MFVFVYSVDWFEVRVIVAIVLSVDWIGLLNELDFRYDWDLRLHFAKYFLR